MTKKDQVKRSPAGSSGRAIGPAAARLVLVGEGLTEEIARRIEAYAPRDIPGPVWTKTLRPFVIPILRASKPVGLAAMERNARVVTLIAAWCVKQGIPLDIEQVLDPDTVERFCSKALKKTPSRGSYRATLRRLGRELTTKAPWEPRPEPMPARKVAPPYSAKDKRALRDDVARQSTPHRRRATITLFLLGAGAGLDGRWARKVRGTDVRRVDGVVLVRVGAPRPREVPVLKEYEEELLALAAEAGDGYLVGGHTTHRNRTNEIVARFEDGHHHPKLEPKRLRSTWIVTHLTLGTRLPELLAAAGTSRIETFDDLLRYVPAMDRRAAWRMLKGSL
ncbi:MAG: hypothetical protein ABI595_05250 [Actinomycetota bacterium]